MTPDDYFGIGIYVALGWLFVHYLQVLMYLKVVATTKKPLASQVTIFGCRSTLIYDRVMDDEIGFILLFNGLLFPLLGTLLCMVFWPLVPIIVLPTIVVLNTRRRLFGDKK